MKRERCAHVAGAEVADVQVHAVDAHRFLRDLTLVGVIGLDGEARGMQHRAAVFFY